MLLGGGRVEQENLEAAGIRSDRGTLSQLGWYLYRDGAMSNFMISGGIDPADRYDSLRFVIQGMLGHCPIIILHGESECMEQLVDECWRAVGSEPDECPLWLVNQQYRDFEPLYGMNEMQVVAVLRALASKLGYSVTPRFERVVRAHLAILRNLDIPYSLSGFYYLCSIDDMEEFYEDVLELPCGEAAAKRIWADLGINADDANNQFDLFRSVISNLAYDALECGWSDENVVSECNCITALRSNGVFALSIRNGYTNLLLPYLCEELKAARVPHVLIIDDIHIDDESFVSYLCAQQPHRSIGIAGQNVTGMIAAGGDDAFTKIAEHVDKFIVLKHSTGAAAEAFSNLFGKFDYIRVEKERGMNKGLFSILPDGTHTGEHTASEIRYRVMPEVMMGLDLGQAIVFDALTNEIIYFN
jgi:hypothetical protein